MGLNTMFQLQPLQRLEKCRRKEFILAGKRHELSFHYGPSSTCSQSRRESRSWAGAGGQGQRDCDSGTAMSVALTVEALLPPVPTMPQGKCSAWRWEFAQALHGDVEYSLLFSFTFLLFRNSYWMM